MRHISITVWWCGAGQAGEIVWLHSDTSSSRGCGRREMHYDASRNIVVMPITNDLLTIAKVVWEKLG